MCQAVEVFVLSPIMRTGVEGVCARWAKPRSPDGVLTRRWLARGMCVARFFPPDVGNCRRYCNRSSRVGATGFGWSGGVSRG